MARKNYTKTDIFLDLIDALRSYDMTRRQIRAFLSERYRRAGSFDGRCRVDEIEDALVSEKTVTRTLDAVRKRYGNRLDRDDVHGTYRLYLDDFPDTLTPDELQALDVAIQKTGKDVRTKTLLDGLKTKLTTRLFRKIQQRDPARGAKNIANIQQKIDADFAFIGPHAKIDINPDIKAALDRAIAHQHKILMSYKGWGHTVCPLGIMYGPNNVYLIATPVVDGVPGDGPHTYILGAISEITDTGEWFARDNSFTIETYANSMFSVYHEPDVYDVEWRVSPDAAVEARRYQFHPTQQITENPDGGLTVRFRAGGLDAISRYIAQWGGTITPVAPRALIQKYRNFLRRCLESVADKKAS